MTGKRNSISTHCGARNDRISQFFRYVIYQHIPYFYTVKVSKGKFVPLVIREGPETQPIGFPAVLFPISVRTEIGCPRGTSAKGFYSFEKEKRIATGLKPLAMTRDEKTDCNDHFICTHGLSKGQPRAFILKNKIYKYTQRRADKRRYSRGKQSPLKAARFLFYCKQRGRAGPMHK